MNLRVLDQVTDSEWQSRGLGEQSGLMPGP